MAVPTHNSMAARIPQQGKEEGLPRNGLNWTKRFFVIAGALDIQGEAITSSTGKWSSHMEAVPTSLNCRQSWWQAGRTGCLYASTFCGVTRTFVVF
jgi:hypothetical protein